MNLVRRPIQVRRYSGHVAILPLLLLMASMQTQRNAMYHSVQMQALGERLDGSELVRAHQTLT